MLEELVKNSTLKMDKNFYITDMAIIRRPLYDFKGFLKIPNDDEKLNRFIKSLWDDKVFGEAILIASYELYQLWLKQNLEQNLKPDDLRKLNYTILKYFIRMSTRSTPFGLFSTNSMFKINDIQHSYESFKTKNNIKRYSSINLSFLFQIINKIQEKSEFKYAHKYIINQTIYKIGNNYRYVETISKNDKREYVLSSIEIDEVLELLHNNINEAIDLKSLAQFLVNNIEDITLLDAENYVESLIDNQFLVNEIDICLNERSPISQLIEILKLYQNNTKSIQLKNYISSLEFIKSYLIELDNSLGGNNELYYKVFRLADNLDIEYNKKQLINVNLQEEFRYSFLNEKNTKEIYKAIRAITKFMIPSSKEDRQSNLNRFKEAFYNRYENQEVSLVEALDTETGIGYNQEQVGSNDFSELIDDLIFTRNNDSIQKLDYYSKNHEFWNELLLDAYAKNSKTIDLKNVDLSGFEENLDLLRHSFTVSVEKSSKLIYISSIEQQSVLNYIARFTNENSSFDEAVEKIRKYEEINRNIVYAELLHLPDYRSGNIMLRHIKYKYEIAYLSKCSNNAIEIPISDLYIKVFNNEISIRSKLLNKEIRISNSNVHNHHYNCLPIYQFLSDLQYQNMAICSLNLGTINTKAFNYLPRITYGTDIVLLPSSWKIYKKDITPYIKKDLSFLKKILKKRGIAQYVYIGEGDNKLMIDIENDVLLNVLIKEFQKRNFLILTECLYNPSEDEKANEILIPFVRKNYEEKKYFINNVETDFPQRKFIPADDWLYYKIYTGINTSDKILIELVESLIANLKKKNLINKWHFVRFFDPESHLRIRLEISSSNKEKKIGQIISLFNQYFKELVNRSIIWKIELGTYNRELERYGGKLITFAEKVFFFDSEMVIQLLNTPNKNNLWLYSIKCIDIYLNTFYNTIEVKHQIIDSLYHSYLDEFNADKSLKRQIDFKYRTNKNLIQKIIAQNISHSSDEKKIINEFSINLMSLKNCNCINSDEINSLINSILHMHINRIIRSNQRLHELVIYGLLSKYYKTQIGIMKFKS